MNTNTLVIVLLVLLIVGAIPRWGFNNSWGYAPLGGVVTVILILLVLRVLGVI